MNQSTLHEIGNYLYQIISHSEHLKSLQSCSEVSLYAEKIRKNAYAIDSIMSDFSVKNQDIVMPSESMNSIDFERFSGMKVLIVDDVAENIKIMENIFKTFSCEMVSANSGEEAIKVYKNGFFPEIVCMDIVMPGMDGAQTTMELKSLGSKAFFIAVSALKNQPKSVTSVFDFWLPKPFTVEHIVGALIGCKSAFKEKSEEDSPFALELDEETKGLILERANNGAYTSLKMLIATLPETKSKEFLKKSLEKMDFDAMVKSIVSP